MDSLTNKLESINACREAVEWIQSFNSYKEAWDKCERGDWMLWIASKAGVDLRAFTKAKVECAKLVEHLMTDERSIEALRTAERFADGMATQEDLEESAVAARAAAFAAYTAHDAVYTATYSAAHAATYSAVNAAYAVAAHVAEAVYAAAYTDVAYADAYTCAAYAAADSAYKETLDKCANICRQYLDFNAVGAFLDSING